MKPLEVLIIDDDVDWARDFCDLLMSVPPAKLVGNDFESYKFTIAGNQQVADQAVADAGPAGFHLVFLDLLYTLKPEDPPVEDLQDKGDKGDFQGMKWLPVLRRLLPNATIVIITGYPKSGKMQNVVSAIRDYDANDFIPKTQPFDEMVPRIRVAHETAQRMRQLMTVEREFFSLLRTRAARSQTYAEDVAALLGRAKTSLHRIAQRIESGDTSAIAGAANAIRTEFEHLRNEFDDLTQVLNKGQESLAVVDVSAETRLVLQLYQKMIIEIQAEIVVDDLAASVILKTYKSDLKVALHEVITNALESLKHSTPQSERRRLQITVKKIGEDAVIRVADNGPGFCDHAIEHMFERGFTTHHDQHQGLGLYIAKRMMNQIGGDIEARNNPEGGAEVHLTVKNLGEM